MKNLLRSWKINLVGKNSIKVAYEFLKDFIRKSLLKRDINLDDVENHQINLRNFFAD